MQLYNFVLDMKIYITMFSFSVLYERMNTFHESGIVMSLKMRYMQFNTFLADAPKQEGAGEKSQGLHIV